MAVFNPPPDAPAPVRHVLDVLETEIERQFAELSTKEQNEFWAQLHGYALAQEDAREPRRAPLIASEGVTVAVRRALELLDASIARHLKELEPADRARFWAVLHEFAARQIEATRQSAGGFHRHSSF